MESAFKCAEEVGGEACLSAEEAVHDADIIVTVTLSLTPVLKKAWIKPGCHINGKFKAFCTIVFGIITSCRSSASWKALKKTNI